jgi:hypothetical protein
MAAAVAVSVVMGGAALGTATATAQAPSVHHRASTAEKPKHLNGWTQLSTGTLDSLETISMARFGKDVQLVWRQENGGGTESLHTRILNSSSKPASASIQVLPVWDSFNAYPSIVTNGSQRLISFSGLRTTVDTDPFSRGFQYVATSSQGTTWTLTNDVLSNKSSAFASFGSDVVNAAGSLVQVYTDSDLASDPVSYHSGIHTGIPAVSTDDPMASSAASDALYTGVGYDAKSAQTWAVWFSDHGDAHEGVNAQQILPTKGTLALAPGASVKRSGSFTAVQPRQRIDVTARKGGGLYAGYAMGAPEPKRVALWRLGSKHPLTMRGGSDVTRVDTAVGKGGRVWLFWRNDQSKVIKVARSNRAVTRLGAVCSVATPRNATDVWSMAGDGARGPLQIAVNAGSFGEQIFSRVVHPCLSVSVRPHRLSSDKKGRIKVRVSDAGDPVRGAVVHFAGHAKKTNKHGKVTFTVAKGTGHGKHSVTVKAHGYTTARTHVTVR